MRFGNTLRNAIYPEWKDQYIDYAKLKSLLRENADEVSKWTEDDENKFCDEIFNVQLEKVAAFQESTFKSLEQRASKAAEKLHDLAPDEGNPKGDITTQRFKELEGELDDVLEETKRLKKYSEINYTGFLKIVKKHDRKRGNSYKIRPMLMTSLSKRPFNSEQAYHPLLNKLSTMFFVVRQQLDESELTPAASSDAQSETHNGERYTAYKFWVHLDNLLELKTYVLRRLPVLVYSEQSSSKSLETQGDPTLNSLYFDNQEFSLYKEKVDQQADASSLRVRWYGQLDTNSELVLELKRILGNGTSEEKRIPIKEKYIQPFIKGEYKMEKSIQKMERQGQQPSKIEDFKNTVAEIQNFILERDLQPVLRAVYTRTAFQKPLDDKVRISIDTSLAFIREDSMDSDRPCRSPDSWHRVDIDNSGMTYPFTNINKGEISLFPYAILEIKVKDDGSKKDPKWIEDLMASHLVHKAPRFSKFVHGVASLFEDNVNTLPFWLSEIETDIRKDPQTAFEEEEQRKATRAANDQVVGSFYGTPKPSASYKAAISSPLGKSYLQERLAAEDSTADRRRSSSRDPRESDAGEGPSTQSGYGTMSSVFPSFSLSRYAQARREKEVQLPPGVTKPTLLIKDSGPLQVEPKVWLANERTFLKWQHISVLLGTLAVALYNSGRGDITIQAFSIVFLFIAAFAGVWGYAMHRQRRDMIVARSGKDFDNWIGPVIVCVSLIVVLILNFIIQGSRQKNEQPGIKFYHGHYRCAMVGASERRFEVVRENVKDRERKQRKARPAASLSPHNRLHRSHSAGSPHARSEPRRSSGARISPRASPTLLQALPEWPPIGVSWDGNLSQGKAMECICSGVPVFKGHKRPIPHTSEEYYSLYATVVGNAGIGSDVAEPYYPAFSASSFPLQGGGKAGFPWETLEQPSMAFCYGTQPGTITLNHWVGLSSHPAPPIELRDPGVKPREVDLSTILERLIYLEKGFEEDYEELLYKNLYKNLLRDPDKYKKPHKGMETQIADLITVLSRAEWIDFSRPENQVVAKFFANASYTEQGRYKTFFHQLLLSMELDYRIHSKQHTDLAKERLLGQLPPCIAWDLALARKWHECMTIEKFKTSGDPEMSIRFHLKMKKGQVKALRKFARAMKWPNLAKVDEILKERDSSEKPLEDRSSDTMSYFTGMILPGVTLPFLIMNSLIDCDADAGGNSLASLTHMYPHSGFQYKSTTYWTATSIVGKVLAPTCREIGGWIGPARPAPDLGRIQIARLRQRKPKQFLTIGDTESMTERSDPLGPPSDSYPVAEFHLLLPDLDPDKITDTIRIEKLALKSVSSGLVWDHRDKDKPLTYDAAVQFAIDGQSWPLRLSYDVNFVAACPCARGPHPLFFDYVYEAVKVYEILKIKDWGGLNGGVSSIGATSSSGGTERDDVEDPDDAKEKVLCIEAFGVADNEVLARAWCSHWGLSAVVADVDRTCMACAIREAYAACLNVVILIEGDAYDGGDGY